MVNGDRLRAALKAAGMTQAELAEASGVSAAAVSRYTSGKRSPSRETLGAIAGALGVNPQWLTFPLVDSAELAGDVLAIAGDMELDAEGLWDECPQAAEGLHRYSERLRALFGEESE